jgi:hypothetical protein
LRRPDDPAQFDQHQVFYDLFRFHFV